MQRPNYNAHCAKNYNNKKKIGLG